WSSASRRRETQLATNLPHQEFVDFPVPRHRGHLIGRGVDVHAVLTAIAQQRAAMRLQMPDEVVTFHEASSNGSLVTVCPASDLSVSSRFASRTIVTASCRFSRAPTSVAPWVFVPGSSARRPKSMGH